MNLKENAVIDAVSVATIQESLRRVLVKTQQASPTSISRHDSGELEAAANGRKRRAKSPSISRHDSGELEAASSHDLHLRNSRYQSPRFRRA